MSSEQDREDAGRRRHAEWMERKITEGHPGHTGSPDPSVCPPSCPVMYGQHLVNMAPWEQLSPAQQAHYIAQGSPHAAAQTAGQG